MKTYKQLYKKTLRIGKIRLDEYATTDFIDDVNEISRRMWDYIFNVKNGFIPDVANTEVFSVSTEGDFTHTRIAKGKIEKIVFDICDEVPKKTNPNNCVDCFTYSYNYDEVTLVNALVGDYTIYYTPEYTEITSTEYDDDKKPLWLKNDFVSLLYLYPALLNTDTQTEKISELYKSKYQDFEDFYRDSEDFEDVIMREAPTNKL